MNIEFYTFDKKYNSTKRPTLNSGTTYDCYLKTSSSIISPTIELNIGLTVNPSAFNYAYISDYGRYYWVSEWTFANSSWFASLNVDVLASWKPYIGDTNMYVYRSSADYNGYLIDTKYPTQTGFTLETVDLNQGTPITQFSDGCYVVGIFGNNSNTSTVCYYVFTPTHFSTLIQSLYATANDTSLWGVIEKGIRNSIMDLSSYIKSCIWLPVSQAVLINSTDSPLTSIDVGAFSITGIECYALTVYGENVLYRFEAFEIPRHPQASTRGAYCNCKPYTHYKLVFMPYGVFEIDTLSLQSNNYFVIQCLVDPISGSGVMRCYATPTDPNLPTTTMTEVCVATARVGIELPVLLQSANINAMGGGLTSAGFSMAMGNPVLAGVFAGAVLGCAQINSQPIDKVGNVSGSFGMLNYAHNVFECRFFTLVAENNSANGRPLYANRLPKNISGYIEGDSDNFSCPATDSEQTEIRRFIDNGFYYE